MVKVLSAASLLFASRVAADAGDTCSIPGTDRVDCWPNAEGQTQETCEARGCCWSPALNSDEAAGIGQPWCFVPTDAGYTLSNVKKSATGFEGDLAKNQPANRPRQSPFGGDIEQLHVSVQFESKSSVRVRITDPANARFEVPLPAPLSTGPFESADADITVNYTENPFSIEVVRKEDGITIFSTKDVGALVYSDQYLQWSNRLSSSTLYGLGEHALPLNLVDAAAATSVGSGRSDVAESYQQLEAFARDQASGGATWANTNLYGDHPFYMSFDNDSASSKVHGVFLLNSNAMEIALQGAGGRKEGRILTWRTIGGIIDLRVFAGPSPAEVVQQYTAVVGRPFMLPYWSLGFHLCRWGYGSMERTKEITDGMIAAGIPFDTQWNDIDYMERYLDFTYDKDKFGDLPGMVADLHAKGMRYVMITDPGISSTQGAGGYPIWDRGLEQDIFIKRSDGKTLIGEVWPGKTGYPDFFHANATAWWTDAIAGFHSQVPFDGLWIDMNEVSNFIPGDEKGCPTDGADGALESPPYTPLILDRELKQKTICMSATQTYPPQSPTGRTTQYNTHSLYGYSESIATFEAMKAVRPGKRTIVISRSTFPNSGAHAGHWLGDNAATWDDMALSIPGSLTFNIFGIPLVGPDVCGFQGTTTVELCARWMQLGAFFPFSRNHNTIGAPDQDPPSLGETVVKAAKMALTTRYELLPYLYTLFYLAHRDGDTVMRPLFFEFSSDAMLRSADRQFLWGRSLLVTPVLEKGATSVLAYVPQEADKSTRWFSYYTGEELIADAVFKPDGEVNAKLLDAPLEGPINVHVRGGSVLPTQAPNTVPPITTANSRSNPFGLVIAMDSKGYADGLAYFDDGESLDSIQNGEYTLLRIVASEKAEKGIITSTVDSGREIPADEMLGSVRVFGLRNAVVSVTVGGVALDASQWSLTDNALCLSDLSVSLKDAFPITFSAATPLV